MTSSLKPLLAAALLIAGATTAHAHQVWLENAGGQARLHFGEFNDNLRETSPGSLDKFKGVPVLEQRAGATSQRVEGKLTQDAFAYTVAGSADTLFAAATYPLIDRSKRNLPAMYWQPSARWVASLAQPVAPGQALDLVPTGKPGQLKVVFNGTPCPRPRCNWSRPPAGAARPSPQRTAPWSS